MGYFTFFDEKYIDKRLNRSEYARNLTRSLDELFEQFKGKKEWIENKAKEIKEECGFDLVDSEFIDNLFDDD